MCFQSFDPPKPDTMKREVVERLIDEISGKSYSIKLQYRGEPLTDKNIARYVRYAKRRGIVEVMINSNANLLNASKAEELIVAGLDKLICSVEGSNADIYNQTRKGGDFDRVVANIDQFVVMRNCLGYGKPFVRVQMVKTDKNSTDVDAFKWFWSPRVDDVAVEDELDYRAEVLDRTPLPKWSCPQLYQRLIVLADGDIVPCCRSIKGGTGKQNVLGNIKDTTIGEAWRGRKMLNLRITHELGNSHEIDMCAGCGLRKDVVKKVSK